MKLVTIVVMVALICAYFQWGIAYVHEIVEAAPRAERLKLSQSIESAKSKLIIYPDVVAERQEQLTYAKTLLEQELEQVPSELNINSLVKEILETADSSLVKAIPLNTRAADTVIMANSEYCVWNITMSGEGTLRALSNFIYSLERSQIPTAIVKSVMIKPANRAPEDPQEEETYRQVTGVIELAVYARAAEE